MGGVGKSLFGSVGGFGDKLFKETANVVTLGASNKAMEKLNPEFDTPTMAEAAVTSPEKTTSKTPLLNRGTTTTIPQKRTASNMGIQI